MMTLKMLEIFQPNVLLTSVPKLSPHTYRVAKGARGISLTWVVGIRGVHYIEQKDCTAGSHAGGIGEIAYTKVNQIDISHTGRTVQGRAPLCILTLWPHDTTQFILPQKLNPRLTKCSTKTRFKKRSKIFIVLDTRKGERYTIFCTPHPKF